MDLDKNNLSTIFILVYAIISPYLVKWGIELDQGTFVTGMVALVGLIGVLFSAIHPNHIDALGNEPPKNNTLNHEGRIKQWPPMMSA